MFRFKPDVRTNTVQICLSLWHLLCHPTALPPSANHLALNYDGKPLAALRSPALPLKLPCAVPAGQGHGQGARRPAAALHSGCVHSGGGG